MKIGVLGGYGSIGTRHVQNAKALGHDVLIYDPLHIAHSERFERDIYEQCEAVVIASPTKFHEQAIRACIECKLHMLIEKPIAPTIGNALPGLIQLAKDKGLVAMMGCNLRFHPCVILMKELLREGNSGLPLWASFNCCIEAGNACNTDGVLLSTGAHEVDLAMHLFGPCAPIGGVRDGERMEVFVLDFEHCYSVFHFDSQTPFRTRQFIIATEKQTYRVDLDARKVHRGRDIVPFPGGYPDDYKREMETFIDLINGKTNRHAATAEDGLNVLRVLMDVRL